MVFKKEKVITSILLVLVAAALLVTILTVPPAVQRSAFEGRDIRCAMQLGRYDDTTRGLITGYNYHLLKTLAEHEKNEIEIIIARRGDDYTDSLRDGSVEMLILPFQPSDSGLVSLHMDSLAYWVLRDDDPGQYKALKDWMLEYQRQPGYKRMRSLYLDTFNNPYNVVKAGIVRDNLSPYDTLFRHWADTLGWDWRFLAAVAYQESKFHIEARSHRGAHGLMQITETTGKRFAMSNPHDPEESIMVAVRYLVRLRDMFMSQARTREDLRKISLAAYNAGQGHIKDCIHYAQLTGRPSDTWEAILDVMPLFAKDSVCVGDSIRYSPFRIDETRSYVEDIYSLYSTFCLICPQ